MIALIIPLFSESGGYISPRIPLNLHPWWQLIARRSDIWATSQPILERGLLVYPEVGDQTLRSHYHQHASSHNYTILISYPASHLHRQLHQLTIASNSTLPCNSNTTALGVTGCFSHTAMGCPSAKTLCIFAVLALRNPVAKAGIHRVRNKKRRTRLREVIIFNLALPEISSSITLTILPDLLRLRRVIEQMYSLFR